MSSGPSHDDEDRTEALRLSVDSEVYEQFRSLGEERRRHFLATFQEFVEDKFLEILVQKHFSQTKDSSSRGIPHLGPVGTGVARLRRRRRGAPGPTLSRSGRRHFSQHPLQALLKPAGRLASFELLEELEAQNTVRRFGHHSWGHSLFDEHKELAFGWQRGLLGVRSPRTEAYRRRRCGVKASGQAVPFDANSVHVSDMLLCYPEEGAVCSVSLVAEPATSPTGQIMTIARDGDGTLERVFLDNQLPCVGPVAAELAQARFAKGTKLTIMEPLLLVTRDGLRGIAVRAGEVRVSSLGLDPAQARALGNKAVASQQYAAAAEFYCLGLQHSEMDMLVIVVVVATAARLQ
ncbi:unnamed protein product [Effrenium voratum]|nr:unnamed protein product [Effrenium voratum]